SGRAARPVDCREMQVRFREISLDFYPSNIAPKLRKRRLELDRAGDIIVHMRADPVALLFVQLGLDDRILCPVWTGRTRPCEFGGDTVDLDRSLGGDTGIVNGECQVAVGKIDAVEGILEAGIFDIGLSQQLDVTAPNVLIERQAEFERDRRATSKPA